MNIIHKYHIIQIHLFSLFIFMISSSSFANDYFDGWNVDGQHGIIQISGSLSENSCNLKTDSKNQNLQLGNITRNDIEAFQSNPKLKFSFKIELSDCLNIKTDLHNLQTGTSVWSLNQPGIKIRFLAVEDKNFNNIIHLNGVNGIGLLLTDKIGNIMPLGKENNPTLLVPEENILTFYIIPTRTSGELKFGDFSALISFEIFYD